MQVRGHEAGSNTQPTPLQHPPNQRQKGLIHPVGFPRKRHDDPNHVTTERAEHTERKPACPQWFGRQRGRQLSPTAVLEALFVGDANKMKKRIRSRGGGHSCCSMASQGACYKRGNCPGVGAAHNIYRIQASRHARTAQRVSRAVNRVLLAQEPMITFACHCRLPVDNNNRVLNESKLRGWRTTQTKQYTTNTKRTREGMKSAGTKPTPINEFRTEASRAGLQSTTP